MRRILCAFTLGLFFVGSVVFSAEEMEHTVFVRGFFGRAEAWVPTGLGIARWRRQGVWCAETEKSRRNGMAKRADPGRVGLGRA